MNTNADLDTEDEPLIDPIKTMRWSDIAWALAIGICVAAIVVPVMVK
jgi:hypothetical protein